MRPTKRIWMAVSLLLVGLIAALPATAQQLTLIGSNFDLSSGLTTTRQLPSVAYNSGDDEYMVVWFDLRNPDIHDIFGQLVSATGTLLSANIPITEFPSTQIDPFVAYNIINNEYLVAWRTGQIGFIGKSRGRLLSSTGTLLGNDFLISAGFEISIAHNPTANEYLLTGRTPGIRARRVSNNGLLIDPEIVLPTEGSPAPNGQVVYNPNANEYLATWRDQVNSVLKGHRISGSGTLLGSVIVVSPLFPGVGSEQPAASVAFDPTNDRYFVVFAVFGTNQIFGQFVSSSGALIGANFLIGDGGNTADPHLAYSPTANSFVIVWRRGNEIVAQLLSENGALIGDKLVIVQGTAVKAATLAANTQRAEFLVVWPDNRNITVGEQDIFAQLIGISSAGVTCDVDGDGDVDITDIMAIFGARNTAASGPDDPSDFDGDGFITINDARKCVLQCTNPRCQP